MSSSDTGLPLCKWWSRQCNLAQIAQRVSVGMCSNYQHTSMMTMGSLRRLGYHASRGILTHWHCCSTKWAFVPMGPRRWACLVSLAMRLVSTLWRPMDFGWRGDGTPTRNGSASGSPDPSPMQTWRRVPWLPQASTRSPSRGQCTTLLVWCQATRGGTQDITKNGSTLFTATCRKR